MVGHGGDLSRGGTVSGHQAVGFGPVAVAASDGDMAAECGGEIVDASRRAMHMTTMKKGAAKPSRRPFLVQNYVSPQGVDLLGGFPGPGEGAQHFADLIVARAACRDLCHQTALFIIDHRGHARR